MLSIENAPHNVNFRKYDSLLELFNTIQGLDLSYGKWAGRDMPTAMRDTLNGVSEEETRRAKDIMDKVNVDFGSRHRDMMVRNVSGHRVNIGAYVSGNPNCMVKRRRVINEFAPIKMVIETTVSGGMDAEAIQARGAALAALAVVISRLRPVELYAAWGLGDNSRKARIRSYIGMVKIPTTPCSLSQAVAVMATEGFARRIAFTEIQRARAFNYGGWAISRDPQDEKRIEQFREAIGLKPEDIFIAGGHMNYRSEIIRDPVAWVHEQVKNQR